jgi:hemolysin III
MIYFMIAGTYTPFTVAYAGALTVPILCFIWIAAAVGFYSKVLASHRINSMATITYLALGWIPAIPLSMAVPRNCLYTMALGGIAYSIGVLFLKYDSRVKYFHSVWHLLVITAACIHYAGIYWFVVAT